MFAIPEPFSSATKTNFEAQVAMLTSLTDKAFESVEKVVDLNMNAAKASLEESMVAAKQLISAKDPQEFFSLTTAQTRPTTEKALAYSHHLANIASNAQAEFTKLAEAQIAETNREVLSLIKEVTKNMPAGSENVVAMIKTAIGNTNAGYEQLTKTTKQVAETLETNISTAASKFSEAAGKATGTAKK